MKALRRRMTALEALAEALMPRPEPPREAPPVDLVRMGALLNSLCDCQHLDRVDGLRHVLETSLWREPLPPSLIDWAVDGFRSFVAAGGPKDLKAWMTSSEGDAQCA